MIINATDEQILKMAKLAILASRPMGMGFYHYNSQLKEEEIQLKIDGKFFDVDYYQGRMTKFHAMKVGENQWKFNERISADYQSWISKYPSIEKLAAAAGVK